MLDAGLRNWASVLREATGRDVNVPGAGAAGGFPASFLAFTAPRWKAASRWWPG